MGRNCSKCGDLTCTCAILAGDGVAVVGTGASETPWLVSAKPDPAGPIIVGPDGISLDPCLLVAPVRTEGNIVVAGEDPSCLGTLSPGAPNQILISNGDVASWEDFPLGPSLAKGHGVNTGATLTTSYVDFATTTQTSSGGQIVVQVGMIVANLASGANRTFNFKVLCDGVDISPSPITNIFVPVFTGLTTYFTYGFTFAHNPAAGSHIWKLQMQASAAAAVGLSHNFINIQEKA